MLTAKASGAFAIVTTPFDADGALDLGAVPRLMRFLREAGCDGVTLLGVMGEAPKMTSSETRALLQAALAEAGDMTVLVGLGAMGVAPFAERALALIDQGAHGVMVNAPGTLKTDAEGVAFFTGIGLALQGAPWVLQDFPLATGSHLPVETLESVARDCPNLMMIKQEDWPGWRKITRLKGGPRDLSILSGFGGLYLPEDLDHGSDGAMTGFSFPEAIRAIVDTHKAGDLARRDDIFDAFLPVIRAEMSLAIGLAVRKYILFRRGVQPTPLLRAPGMALTTQERARVDLLLDRLLARCTALEFPLKMAPLGPVGG